MNNLKGITNMKLSEYCNEKESLWNKIENENTEKLIKYINDNIDDDLSKIAKTNDSTEVFNKLKVWLFKFYNKQLLEGLKYINADYERFKKSLIYSLILGITRNKSNIELLYDVLKSAQIIEKIITYEDGTYEIITNDFGRIQFIKAEENFINDKETLDFVNNLENDIQDGCHEISFYLIKKYEIFKAVTSICKKGIDHSYYHSFVLDDVNNVIDFTTNLIMPKEQYYILQEVHELNCINYKEYLDEKNNSIQFDESKTLYNLLRNAVYKQYLLENKKKA
mgnify:CR=1 FL=1